MLTQFQTLYPTGSLISELLTIYQGKFIVRVSAQVEGVSRATGMAAAETLELAEDKARERAIAVLVSEASTPSAAQPEIAGDLIPTAIGAKQLSQSPEYRDDFMTQTQNQAVTTVLNDQDVFVAATPDSVTSADTANDRDSQDLSLNDFTATPLDLEPDLAFDFETTPEIPPSSDKSAISFSNVTPLVPRSYNSADTIANETIAPTKEVSAKRVSQSSEQRDDFTVATSQPIDLSDAIARTNVELKRLEWSNQDGRKYLEKTYGKRSRQHLTDQELLEFLHYLESLPSP